VLVAALVGGGLPIQRRKPPDYGGRLSRGQTAATDPPDLGLGQELVSLAPRAKQVMRLADLL